MERRALLEAPYWPFDGMNSAGLAVAMMAVLEAEGGSDPAKPTLNELQVMRLLLDRTTNVQEAGEESLDRTFTGILRLHSALSQDSHNAIHKGNTL